MPIVVAQVGSEDGSVYANLTLPWEVERLFLTINEPITTTSYQCNPNSHKWGLRRAVCSVHTDLTPYLYLGGREALFPTINELIATKYLV